jgi:hypothetical protein
MSETIQITADHLCAGLVIGGGHVRKAAPILKYMAGWRIERVEEYCRKRYWQCVKIKT